MGPVDLRGLGNPRLTAGAMRCSCAASPLARKSNLESSSTEEVEEEEP